MSPATPPLSTDIGHPVLIGDLATVDLPYNTVSIRSSSLDRVARALSRHPLPIIAEQVQPSVKFFPDNVPKFIYYLLTWWRVELQGLLLFEELSTLAFEELLKSFWEDKSEIILGKHRPAMFPFMMRNGDDKKLFELLVLSGALAELTWPTILSKSHIFSKRHMFSL